jgi:hypothetical protein
MVKNLFFSLLITLFSFYSFSYELVPFENTYKSGKHTAVEKFSMSEDGYWLMESTIKHSLFSVSQEARFLVKDKKVLLHSAFRKIRALGGLRREFQSFAVNYDTNEIDFVFNRKKGKIKFAGDIYESLTLQIQAKFDVANGTLPLKNEYNFLNKGDLKSKTFEFSKEGKEIKFQELRNDEKGFIIWFLSDENLITSRILQKGAIVLSWELEPKP